MVWFLEMKILINFFHFYFLAKDFSLNIVNLTLKFCRDHNNINLEGTVSHISYLDPSFCFNWKKRETFSAIFKHFFPNFIRQKLRPIENDLRHSSLYPDLNSND